ncbi:MAG: molybdopterin cofactor-binding domain-containing protein [Cyclobacteriaceae bacterium]|jgi:isoquinoline 1-oxidoreductase beta subunit|nr:xanthine dehydrogenase family protein molybdopterin-binding subunit [Flammeovirgaceae bacterium]
METTPKNISRRNFIKLSGLTGTALTLGFSFSTSANELDIWNATAAESSGVELNAWISIDTNGKVTLMNHRSEMGQGSFQSVPQMIAEELEVALDQVNIIFAPGNGRKYGSQVTGGSSTIRGSYKKLLRLGASAREMLIETAAKKWGVNKSECYAENGTVIHRASGKKFHYGELVTEAAKLEAPKDVALKNPKDYKLIRKPLPRQDTPMKVNGKAVFGLDFKLPSMLYAVVERSPRFQGKVIKWDDTETKKVPGVRHVLKVTRDEFGNMREGVAVVADNTWAAMQGRKALKIEWDDTAFPHHSTEELYTKMREQVKGEMISFRTMGNTTSAFAKAEKKVEATYETPYESHSCMEPLNCVANVTDDKIEIWGPIQGPDWIQQNICAHFKLPPEKVIVNMTFLGGGFGRKAFTDYPYEAVMISKEIKAPVQVIWTREDDMTIGPFRPGMVYQCKGAVTGNGRIGSFETKISGQNMDMQNPGADKTSYNGSDTEGFLEGYFESIPHYSFGDSPLDSPVPVMWWRSVYSSTNAFAFESFIDELAVQAAKDPIDFRRQHLGERYQLLMNKLEQVSGWKERGKNTGYGVAITECFSSIVGEVVKVSKTADGKIKIDKVWAVMDCGWYVNPDIIKAQVEGSIVMALGAATKHETTFKDGKAVERNFVEYKMPRIQDIPEIEVHIMDNEEKAGGVGEPGLPPFTPALTNAIFDLTGTRIRRLPFSLDKIG